MDLSLILEGQPSPDSAGRPTDEQPYTGEESQQEEIWAAWRGVQGDQFRSSYKATEVAQSKDPRGQWELQSTGEKVKEECVGGVGWGGDL